MDQGRIEFITAMIEKALVREGVMADHAARISQIVAKVLPKDDERSNG